ncbi:MAG TPA: hypothetical protein DEA90_05265 [Opitutae bacterium]|nr:hypothetical protein [Opitutae bacterium]
MFLINGDSQKGLNKDSFELAGNRKGRIFHAGRSQALLWASSTLVFSIKKPAASKVETAGFEKLD